MSIQDSTGRHRVAIIGLGKLGLLFVERLARRNDMDLIGVVDVSPDKVGVDLDEVAGRETGFDLVVHDSIEAVASADVALVATALGCMPSQTLSRRSRRSACTR
jgi:hypothetical protein